MATRAQWSVDQVTWVDLAPRELIPAEARWVRLVTDDPVVESVSIYSEQT